MFIDELQRTSGIDIPVEELCITLRQPRIKDIAILGETNYFVALQLFTMNTQKLKIDTPGVNSWMILQESLKQKIEGVTDTKVLVKNFLQLFFNQTVNFGPRSLMIMTKEGIQNIEPEDLDKLQELIGILGGKELLSKTEETFNPKNKRAAEIAEKMKKARKRLAQIKAAEKGIDLDAANKKGFLSKYIRVVAIGTSNSLEEVNNMTILQLNEMMQMYLAKEAYDLETGIRLAGGKSDKELVHWSTTDPYHKEDDSIGRI